MPSSKNPALSVVVPLYNESAGVANFHASLIQVVDDVSAGSYEIIYCDDGSADNTGSVIKQLRAGDSQIKLISLSKNFGKENALAAGISQATGQAIIMLDGDGQHPVELIPKFVDAWKAGAQVVVGVRSENQKEGFTKRFGSKVFYKLFNSLTGQKMLAGSTDFRLIDKVVQQAFLELKESDRITRGLIDWLGFKRELIYFTANARQAGSASYSNRKLIRLATDSFVSLSPTPLYLFGYLGVFITFSSLLLGLSVILEQLILGDPWHWKFTGTAMLGILIIFLVGIVLMSQGILSLYISHIHTQSKQRPLYIIDYGKSAGIE